MPNDLTNTKPVSSSERSWKEEVIRADPEHYNDVPDAYEFSTRTFKDRRNPYENMD